MRVGKVVRRAAGVVAAAAMATTLVSCTIGETNEVETQHVAKTEEQEAAEEPKPDPPEFSSTTVLKMLSLVSPSPSPRMRGCRLW